MENLYTPNCIRTHSGIYFNVIEPTEDMVDINDIAHALSHQCRFGGHLPEFYSVAQHSVFCAKNTPVRSALQALMHDAAEAYLLDIPSPIKAHLHGYKEMEERILKLIFSKFKIEYPLNEEVKQIDETMLKIEWEVLMLKQRNIEHLQCWSPNYAKGRFMEMFEGLSAASNLDISL